MEDLLPKVELQREAAKLCKHKLIHCRAKCRSCATGFRWRYAFSSLRQLMHTQSRGLHSLIEGSVNSKTMSRPFLDKKATDQLNLSVLRRVDPDTEQVTRRC